MTRLNETALKAELRKSRATQAEIVDETARSRVLQCVSVAALPPPGV